MAWEALSLRFLCCLVWPVGFGAKCTICIQIDGICITPFVCAYFRLCSWTYLEESMMAKWTQDKIPDQSGKLVLITGANTGLGLGTAKVLADKSK